MTSKTGRTPPRRVRGETGDTLAHALHQGRRRWVGGAQSSRPGPPPPGRGVAHLAPILHPCVVQSALRIRDEAGAGGKHPGLVLCCPPDALSCRRTRGILAP